MKGWFNIRILIILIHYANILRREIQSLTCITINAEKLLYQIYYLPMVNNINKLGVKENILNLTSNC